MFPWIWPALAWMAGIAMADGHDWPFWPFWWTTLLALASGWVAHRHCGRRLSLCLVLLTCVLGGITRTLLAQTAWDPLDLRHHVPSEPVWLTVEGILLDAPQSTSAPAKPGSPAPVVSTTLLEVTSLQWPHQPPQPRHGTIRVRWKGPFSPCVHAGSPIRTEGVLRPLRPAPAPGLFDPALVYGRRGIYYELLSDTPQDVENLSPQFPDVLSWKERFQHWGMETLSRGLKPGDPHVQACWNMVLGSSLPIPPETKEAYMRTGTLHIFAISGLHITLLAQLLTQLLRGLGCPRRLASALVLPLIWTYTALTGWQASAIRSTIMASVLEGGVLLARPSSVLNSLAAAAFLILAWDPNQLFQTGFQLSFLVVLALACSPNWIRREPTRGQETTTENDLSDWIQEQPPSQARRIWSAFRDHVLMALKMSVAAWLISAPLIAQSFHLCTPVSLIANLAIVPLSSLVLGSCLASLLSGELSPWMGSMFNHASWFLMDVMTQLAEALTHLPGAWFHVPDLGWDGVILSYLLVLGTAPFVWKTRPYPLIFLSILTLTTAASLLDRTFQRSAGVLHLLPVRGSGTLWIQSQRGHASRLLNGGHLQDMTWITIPFVQAQGFDRIPEWIITHPNTANMGGGPVLEKQLNPITVAMPPSPRRSPATRAWTQSRAESKTPPEIWTTKTTSDFWQVLHPQPDVKSSRAAETALVLQCTVDEVRILILPDLPRKAQADLVRFARERLESEILITGVSTEGDELSDALLDWIQPHWILICDHGRRWHEGAQEAYRLRLEAAGMKALFLSDWEYLRLSVDGDQGWVDRFEGGLRGRGYQPVSDGDMEKRNTKR